VILLIGGGPGAAAEVYLKKKSKGKESVVCFTGFGGVADKLVSIDEFFGNVNVWEVASLLVKNANEEKNA
jgi:hypothetical protein